MNDSPPKDHPNNTKVLLLVAAFVFLYASVLTKLGLDWWSDENYSHGLLVPFVIGLIVWRERYWLKQTAGVGAHRLGGAICIGALLLLLTGVLGAELFTTRISMVIMLAGIAVCLFGTHIVRLLLLPLALLVLAIPIPQILFNRIAFPLQIWASRMAVWGIRLFEIPATRQGNVFDIVPAGSTETISLEVVGACSGIRSLMTLVTLALVLGYFTSPSRSTGFVDPWNPDLWRTAFLMILAVPIAVLTNAARVTLTGILTYYYGRQATESTWHELSGWLVYLVSLGLLLGSNYLLGKIFSQRSTNGDPPGDPPDRPLHFEAPLLPLIALMVIGGVAVAYFINRGDADIPRRPLSGLPAFLGNWHQIGAETRFDAKIEGVLRTSDYVVRDYAIPKGWTANVYVGYYLSQRSGATYHSPQNCLPGAGWVMSDPKYIEIKRANGTTFLANQYIIENGPYREVMIYWYQGRGRAEASEYVDKLHTIWDSVTRGRSDGAFVRVVTNIVGDEDETAREAADLSAALADALPPFVPE